MVLVTDRQYYMDGNLKSNFDIAKSVIKKDWDMVFCYDGSEGSGKSVKAMQDAFYCDPTFNLDRVVFTPISFKKAIVNSQKYQSIIYDEAYTGLSSRASMSLINRTLISMLAEIRQKNLFVFVVMPCFFDLDKYVALWRSRALIHVYTGDNFERGYFAFYNTDKKKILYTLGKKFYSYKDPTPNFVGRFTNHYPIIEADYKKKKAESLTDREKKAEEEEIRRQMDDALFERLITLPDKMREKIPNYVMAQILGISEVHFYRKLKQFDQQKGMMI